MTQRVQLADGRVLEFPNGTTLDTIQATVKKMLGVSSVDQEKVANEATQQFQSELAQEQGPLDAAAIAAGRGLKTIGRGLGLIDDESQIETESFQKLEEERPISTLVGEIAGETAPFLLPGGAVAKLGTIPARVAGSALLGATEGGLITAGKGGDQSETVTSAGVGGIVAGGLELAFPHIGRIGRKIFRNVTGKVPQAPLLTKAGQPTPEFVAALDKAGLTFDDIALEANRLVDVGDVDDAVSIARKQFLQDQGIVPTKAQVTGDATQFQAQQELAKTSGKVRRALEGQETVLASRFENAVTETGGSAVQSSSTVVDFIADKAIDLDQAISAAYKAARNVAPKEKIVSPERLVKNIRSIAGSDRATGGLASATRDILREQGVLAPGKGMKLVGKISAESAEQIRINLNSLHGSLTPFGKSKLRDLKASLDLDVEKAVGADVFGGARSAKAKFEGDLSRAKVNKFDTRKKELVRDILGNKINPDRFLDEAVLSKTIRSTDLEQMKRYLLLNKSDAGAAAWNDLRAEAMERIRSIAIKEVAGEPALSRAGIEKALKQFGRDKLRVLFSPDERKFLNDMLKVSKMREPVRGTALGLGPSGQGASLIAKAVNRIPLINSVFGGAAELIASDVGGRAAIRTPKLAAPLKPSQATLLTPAIIPAITTEGDQ